MGWENKEEVNVIFFFFLVKNGITGGHAYQMSKCWVKISSPCQKLALLQQLALLVHRPGT